MFSIICLILSFIIWLSYILAIYIKFKPDSISRSYYLTKSNIFTYWIVIVSFLIFPVWVQISPICFQFLPFLSILSLTGVGICPRYLGSDRTIHIIAASTTCILSLVWNLVTGTYMIPIALLVVILILYAISTSDMFFWIECSAFLNIYLSILIQLI